MAIFDAIKNRRSNRNFLEQEVLKEDIIRLLEAACWAPSGKNGQPWRFAVVSENSELKKQISELSMYRKWLIKAPCLIIVFLDKNLSYDYIKDIQAIGASIQNLLLAAQEMGLGTCWVGEILKQETEMKNILGVSDGFEMMALIAVGYPGSLVTIGRRKSVNDCILIWD